MQLWNDYEGATLAGQWTLGRLLRTEGRSALFATTAPGGKPAILRLTEALNDQAALRARYRAIQAAGDQFLVRVQGFGDAELDSTPLAYAVLEPTAESLADIVRIRRLDLTETLEVAQVVAGGLLALHAQGLVHGLVEPESVLAAGQQIKLRSDCARPAPPPGEELPEDAATLQTDAWGLANIIHQSLTQARLHDASDALALPEPYSAIVRNTARGQWGVPQIAAELGRHARATGSPALAGSAPPAAPAPQAPAPAPRTPAPADHAPRPSAASAAAPTSPLPAAPGSPALVPSREAIPTGEVPVPPPPALESLGRRVAPAEQDEAALNSAPRPNRLYVALALGAAVLVLILFLLLHRGPRTAAAQTASAPAPAPTTPALTTPALTTPAQVSSGPTAAAPLAPTPAEAAAQTASATASGERDVWRVVAYTYNRRGEADRKASAINRRHPNFKADVWSRGGQRPFLVTLGGPMPRDQAMEMRALARQSGVAPDVYAQNYIH